MNKCKIIPLLSPVNGNNGIKLYIFTQFLKYFTLINKIMHILFCDVQYFLYLCTKFCKLCNEFNTKL